MSVSCRTRNQVPCVGHGDGATEHSGIALLPRSNGNPLHPTPEQERCREWFAVQKHFEYHGISAHVEDCSESVVIRVRGLLGPDQEVGDREKFRARILTMVRFVDPNRSSACAVRVLLPGEEREPDAKEDSERS